jgi:four helix bundle protein
LSVIDLVDGFPNRKVYWTIGDQLLRAATSIGANLTEAQGSSSKRDFKRYHEIALKSANETLYWLNLLKDSKKVEVAKIEPLITEVDEIARMIAKGVLKMKGKLA